jgi:hypothetical protein
MMLLHFGRLRKASTNMRKPSFLFFLSSNLRRLEIILGVTGLCLAATVAHGQDSAATIDSATTLDLNHAAAGGQAWSGKSTLELHFS